MNTRKITFPGRDGSPVVLDFENGSLVKINSFRPEHLSGYTMLNTIRDLAAHIARRAAARSRQEELTQRQARYERRIAAQRETIQTLTNELEALDAETASARDRLETQRNTIKDLQAKLAAMEARDQWRKSNPGVARAWDDAVQAGLGVVQAGEWIDIAAFIADLPTDRSTLADMLEWEDRPGPRRDVLVWALNVRDAKTPEPQDVRPSIDWTHVEPQFKWLARDENGRAWLYSADSAPAARYDEWWGDDIKDVSETTAFASYQPGTCDWRDSLVQRPPRFDNSVLNKLRRGERF